MDTQPTKLKTKNPYLQNSLNDSDPAKHNFVYRNYKE